MAHTLGMPLTLFHALEPSNGIVLHPDPLAWDLYRHEVRRHLMRLQAMLPPVPEGVRIEIGEGDRIQAICDIATTPGTTIVLGSSRHGSHHPGARDTALQVIEAGAERVLVVPPEVPSEGSGFARILVPVDGSSLSEAAVSQAMRLARCQAGELTLVHVVAEASPFFFGPPAAADIDLQRRLAAHSEASADHFLDRTRRRLLDKGATVQSLCLKGDARARLVEAIVQHHPDLVIITTHGMGGGGCPNLRIGSTATYLVSHLAAPTLVLRPNSLHAHRSETAHYELRPSATSHAA